MAPKTNEAVKYPEHSGLFVGRHLPTLYGSNTLNRISSRSNVACLLANYVDGSIRSPCVSGASLARGVFNNTKAQRNENNIYIILKESSGIYTSGCVRDTIERKGGMAKLAHRLILPSPNWHIPICPQQIIM